MARDLQDILVVEYDGPQGNFGLDNVESATPNRGKTRARVKTMNRGRRALGFQSGTPDVGITMTTVPERGASTTVNWIKAWDDDEVFQLTIEKGVDGLRELLQDCMVADVNGTYNEAGEAREEVTIEVLESKEEP